MYGIHIFATQLGWFTICYSTPSVQIFTITHLVCVTVVPSPCQLDELFVHSIGVESRLGNVLRMTGLIEDILSSNQIKAV